MSEKRFSDIFKIVVTQIKKLKVRTIELLHNKEFQRQLTWTGLSIILGLLISAVLLAAFGYDPGRAFLALLTGALREPVLQFATPLILTGLSVAIAFKCGLFNIGAEGQLYVGAMAASIIGFMFPLPIFIHIFVCLVIGTIVGGLYAFLPGLLKAYRGAHEVVTTMMLSYSAILLTSWLVGPNGPFMASVPPGQDPIPQTPILQPTAILPGFGPYLHAGIVVSILAVIAVDFFINRTVLGYEMRAVGQNSEAAENAGIDPKKNIAIALGMSGGLAGLAGAGEILGTYKRFIANWSPGLGWDGITVAVLGSNNPWGVLAGALFFGFLRAGGNAMQLQAGVPVEMVFAIQGLIVLFVAAPQFARLVLKMGVQYADVVHQRTQTIRTESLMGLTIIAGCGLLSILIATLSFEVHTLSLILTFVVGVLVFRLMRHQPRMIGGHDEMVSMEVSI